MRQHWPRAAMLDWSCAAPTQDIVAPAVAASHGEMWGSRVAAPALTHACWSSRPRARPARERERFDERNASQPARRATTTTLPLQTLPESGTPGNRGGRPYVQRLHVCITIPSPVALPHLFIVLQQLWRTHHLSRSLMAEQSRLFVGEVRVHPGRRAMRGWVGWMAARTYDGHRHPRTAAGRLWGDPCASD